MTTDAVNENVPTGRPVTRQQPVTAGKTSARGLADETDGMFQPEPVEDDSFDLAEVYRSVVTSMSVVSGVHYDFGRRMWVSDTGRRGDSGRTTYVRRMMWVRELFQYAP